MTKLKFGQPTMGMRLEGVVEIHYGEAGTRRAPDGRCMVDKWIDEAVLTRCKPGQQVTLHRCYHPEEP